jgi:hypothetical protein
MVSHDEYSDDEEDTVGGKDWAGVRAEESHRRYPPAGYEEVARAVLGC